MSLALQIRRYARELAAIVALVTLAGVVSGYILAHQRLRFPWDDTYTLRADFTTAQAVTPGQGQTVGVAGVTVGEIARVTLHDGLARVEMAIERDKLPAVHADARMLIRPKTGLQDMSIELDPGTPRARRLDEDDVLASERTRPSINLDEVVAALDGDTRAWLRTLISAGSRGVDGRGADVRAIFRAGAPTLQRTRRVTRALVGRRGELARVVHRLRLLAGATARKDEEIVRLVAAGNETLSAIARHDGALRVAVQRLPATLDEAQGALAAVGPFAERLQPALTSLRPAARDLAAALPRLDPLLRDGLPAVRRVHGLVRQARTPVRDLRAVTADLRPTVRTLLPSGDIANHIVNELGFNPEGPEEGYLFWLTWFMHNAASILSVEDAHGAVWRGGLIVSCSTYAILPELAPSLAPLVAGSPACPADASAKSRARAQARTKAGVP